MDKAIEYLRKKGLAAAPDFKQFCVDVAMQIAAMNPAAVRREDMDTSKVESERGLLREKALAEGKPEKMGRPHRRRPDRQVLQRARPARGNA